MSRTGLFVAACAGIAAIASGCRTTHDAALKETGLRLSRQLANVRGPVAVAGIYDLARDRQTEYSLRVEEELARVLADNRVPVVTRQRIVETVRQERFFQGPWFADPATSAQAGKMLGARVLVLGTYHRRAKKIRLLLRALDVETGRVVAAAEAHLPENDDVIVWTLGKYPLAPRPKRSESRSREAFDTNSRFARSPGRRPS